MEQNRNNEKHAAKAITENLNSYSFNSTKFAKEMTLQHPTLQQKFVKTVAEYLKLISSENFSYDDRNKQAVAFARDIKEAGLLEKYRFPMI